MTALRSQIILKTASMEELKFFSLDSEVIDLVLAIEGCKTACADLSAFKGAKIRFITKIEDAEKYLGIEHIEEFGSRNGASGP